jgi:hypothetical protein
MAGFGSSHLYYDNSLSNVTHKSIKREDNCRRQFDFIKYDFGRDRNPITGVLDESLLVYPPAESGRRSQGAQDTNVKMAQLALNHKKDQCKCVYVFCDKLSEIIVGILQ